MQDHHNKRYPNETEVYRKARNELLQAEMELRSKVEEVAKMRRALPQGGELKEDYEFRRVKDDAAVKFSDLFAPGKDSLVLYSFMFAPDAETPCTSCNSIADSFDGNARHIGDRVNFYIVAKAPVAKMRDWADSRGWRHLNILSSCYNYYNRDYFAETEDGFQMPILNVFTRRDGKIYHTYGTELLYTKVVGIEPRHVDMVWPLWNTFDFTPDGRGNNWQPKHNYEDTSV